MKIADYQETLFETKLLKNVTVRQNNILRSPKKNGNSLEDSQEYLEELGIEILNNRQPIQFLPNTNEPVHRWSPYVQGFSSKFVQRTIDKYKNEYNKPIILDPFSGSGTVPVQAKMNGYKSYGIELNPLLYFVATTKVNSWKANPEKLLKISRHLSAKKSYAAPDFLKSDKQFNLHVLKNLEKIKGGIDSFEPANEEDKTLKTLEKSKTVTHTPRIHGDRRAKPLYMEEKYGSKKISRVFRKHTGQQLYRLQNESRAGNKK